MSIESTPAPTERQPAQTPVTHLPPRDGHSAAARGDPATEGVAARSTSQSATVEPAARHFRKRVIYGVAGAVLLALAAWYGLPSAVLALTTVSTDDAYVNGHVTSVAPRVQGQVAEVLVDDNHRVKQGDLLVRLDREPYQVKVDIQQALVEVAEADLVAAQANVRGIEAQARSQRWKLQTAIEQVSNQVAALRAAVATLESRQATQRRAQLDFDRGRRLVENRTITNEDFDQRRENLLVAKAMTNEAREQVSKIRVTLGLPPSPEKSADLAQVPENLEQTFSAVRMALADLVQSASQIGLPLSKSEATPQEVLDEFLKQDEQGDVDRILEKLVHTAPAVKQAQAKLMQARRDLEQAQLDLRYCDIVAEIGGVVTRRNVNPGNNVAVGQSLMAVRSLSEIWIDANFKETQLADLRIGQRVRCEVDMYGRQREYEGRITGFTMGTGQSLALLPAQNATGNFVKIVQRLPVRIELTDYDYEEAPLFIGLSVVPYVYFKEPPQGPHAGEFLQPLHSAPSGAAVTSEGRSANRAPASRTEAK
jgi:membrane fusion protein, multidrug efflux system